MPIVRTYGCGQCGHFMEITLTMDQADDDPPECPHCAAQTQQEFKPIAIGGSVTGKAHKLAETIASEDYGVADFNISSQREGDVTKHRLKDQGNAMQQATASSWGAPRDVLETAVQIGRATRMSSGGYSGVDMLQKMLQDGTQPDLIEQSKKRSMKVW